MSDENSATPKKIIIDEDWKSRVAAEKEAAEKEALKKGATEKGATTDSPAPAAQSPPGAGKLPTASFDMLLTTLATEAMMSLGQMSIPGQPQPEVNLPQAQYVIDLLGVLKEKTAGNLSSEETALLEDLLYQLRMMYVQIDANK